MPKPPSPTSNSWRRAAASAIAAIATSPKARSAKPFPPIASKPGTGWRTSRPASTPAAGTSRPGRSAMPSAFAQLTASSSEFLNKRGIYLGRRSTKLHVALYRRSGGRIGGHIPGWPEARLLLLDHTGAKSGVRRTSPLMYQEDGEALVIMASKAGQPTNPAWFHNLVANPETTIQIGAEVREV